MKLSDAVPCPTPRARFARRIMIAMSLLSLVLVPSRSWASWPLNGAPVCTAADDQFNPVLAPDGNGGACIAWVDHRGGPDIYVQRMLSDGTIAPGWPVNGLAVVTAATGVSDIVIAPDGAGGAFIAWRSEAVDGGDIIAQHVQGTGTRWITPVAVCAEPRTQMEPSIVPDGTGGCIITWVDERAGDMDIYGQRLDGAGAKQWLPETGIQICVAAGDQDFPRTVSDGSPGGVIVVWQDGRLASGDDIYAEHVDHAGVLKWGTTGSGIPVCSSPGSQIAPTLASDDLSGALVTWLDAPTSKIFVQRVTAAGTLVWAPAGIDPAPGVAAPWSPALVSDGAKGAIIAFEDQLDPDHHIRAQHLGSTGNLLWGASGLPISATGHYPTIASDGAKGALIAWEDGRNAATADDIYGQHVRSDGSVERPANGIALCSAAGSQGAPVAVADRWSGAFVAWTDSRNGATTYSDIYALRWGAGAPYIEPGFPVPLPNQVISPPAICELDGDSQAEIVLGTEDGFVRAFNHDGSPLWAQGPIGPFGGFPWHSPIAVDDLNGDGKAEVFCGNRTGIVYGFTNTGAPLAGWPRNLGTNDSTYVSIGNILGNPQDQVVACSGNQVWVLRYDGIAAPGFPVHLGSEIDASAAIGDVDGDGDNEIVVLESGGVVDVLRGDGTLQASRVVPSAFKRAPALGDLNLDGRLEIVAATTKGIVYVFNYDGTDYPGAWPYISGGSPISGVALANIRAGYEPEIIFGVDNISNPKVQALYQDGTVLSGYPRPLAMAYGPSLSSEPIVDTIDNGSPDVLIGSPAYLAYAWNNFGVDDPGWPIPLDGECWVSPATGDLDGDGRIEAVFCTDKLAVFDLGANLQRGQPRWWWPMFGFNPQRQHCLDCPHGAVTAVESPTGESGAQLAVPYPNPTRGTTRFSLDLATPGTARLVVRDVAGREVRELLRGSLAAGRHEVSWDGRDQGGGPASPGLYFAQAEVHSAGGTTRLSRRLVILK